jgi:hypothetical protein
VELEARAQKKPVQQTRKVKSRVHKSEKGGVASKETRLKSAKEKQPSGEKDVARQIVSVPSAVEPSTAAVTEVLLQKPVVVEAKIIVSFLSFSLARISCLACLQTHFTSSHRRVHSPR